MRKQRLNWPAITRGLCPKCGAPLGSPGQYGTKCYLAGPGDLSCDFFITHEKERAIKNKIANGSKLKEFDHDNFESLQNLETRRRSSDIDRLDDEEEELQDFFI